MLKVYMSSCRGMLPKVGAVLQGNVAQSGCRPAGERCPKWVSSCRGTLPKVGVVLQGNVAQSGCRLAGECCPKWVPSCRGTLPTVGVVLQGNVAHGPPAVLAIGSQIWTSDLHALCQRSNDVRAAHQLCQKRCHGAVRRLARKWSVKEGGRQWPCCD